MFSVRPVCRYVIMAVFLRLLSALNFLMGDRLIAIISLFSFGWRWLYLTKLKIEIKNHCLVKHSGKLFKHKTVVMLKNIFYIQIFTFAPWLPAIIRVKGQGDRLFIVGLDGRQAAAVEKAVVNHIKY